MLAVNEDNDVVSVTKQVQTVRVHVKDISIQGRNAAGVRVVSMKFKNDSVVAIAETEFDADEEAEMPEQAPAESEGENVEETDEEEKEEDSGESSEDISEDTPKDEE